MKVLKIFFIFLLVVTISIVGIISYWKITKKLIDDGYYNVYSYEMNDTLIKEINSYISEDYFINIKKSIFVEDISSKKYPLLASIYYRGYKTDDGFLLNLNSYNVLEYIYYCNVCNFDYGQTENILTKEFGANIIKINKNIYHVYYDPALDF